jgi:hypothetical protein
MRCRRSCSFLAATASLRLDLLTVTDAARCYLPTQERKVVASLLRADEADLAARLGGEPGDLDVPLPKLVDIADGIAELDSRADLKRPDWTYAESPVRLTSRVDRTLGPEPSVGVHGRLRPWRPTETWAWWTHPS